MTPPKNPRISKADFDAGWLGLLSVMFAGQPDRPAAACVGRPEPFDAADANPDQARRICRGCPYLSECEWSIQ